MKERDCANCKHHTSDGCSSLDCEFEKAMTKQEAIKWLIKPARTSTDIGEIKAKEIEAYNVAIEALKAEVEWIPCSERLPKAEDMYQPPEQRYLCQLEAHGVRKFCVLSRLKGAVSPFWDWYGVAVHDSDVTAWMPLPKPYREDGEA